MRLLRRIEVCGQEYRVLEALNDSPELEGNQGVVDYSKAAIYIAAGYADTSKIDTLLHEIIHTVLHATGMTPKLEKISDSLEEDIVSALTPALRSALKSAGWREPKKITRGGK